MNTRVYFDSEFTGLYQDARLVSVGFVAENGQTFYAEFTNYGDVDDPWIEDNVIANLKFNDREGIYLKTGSGSVEIKGTKGDVKDALLSWILKVVYNAGSQVTKVELWSDCLSYDWVLLNSLWDNALNVPERIYYIPFDICTLAKCKGLDLDFNRLEYSGLTDVKNHNALDDAKMIKACYHKLMQERWI